MVHSLLTSTGPFLVAAAIVLLICASLNDIAVRTIPNGICLALAGIGLLLRLADGAIISAAVSAALVLAATGFCCLRGWMGGGDVKLLTASILLLPPALVPAGIFYVGLAGGLLALVYISLRRLVPRPGPRPAGLIPRICRAELFRVRRGGPLPYGVGIAAGAILVLLKSTT